MRLWPQQNATRRGNGTLTWFAFAKGIKDSELFLGRAASWFIRAQNGWHDIHRLTNVLHLGQAMENASAVLALRPDGAHTGIEFHPDGNRLVQLSPSSAASCSSLCTAV